MALFFPHVPDVRLENSPLVEVICQVRFPPILRIAKEEPSEFQEAVRDRFPELAPEQAVLLKIPEIGSGGELGVDAMPRLYRFRTADGTSSISLSSDFYALSTSKYTNWGDFGSDLGLAHDTARTVYKLPYATRIGVRYINRLTFENTGANDAAELLGIVRQELTALVTSEGWSAPQELLSQLVLLDEQAKLTFRTVYGTEDAKPFFVLDMDYFEEGKLPLDDLIERANRYHQKIYDAFRWSILPDKFAVFGPLENGN